MKITPLILSGGSGTRLWPLSREQFPKQFLKLFGKHTMLQETLLRLKKVKIFSDPIISCRVEHRFLVAEQCQEIGVTNPIIILEPVAKNTAPAITAATMQLIKKDSSSTLMVLASDHVIKDIDTFRKSIEVAYLKAQQNSLITFGVKPLKENTEYGYIKISNNDVREIYKVDEFVEKPNIETAKVYVSSGYYLWNSGMFMFKPNAFIHELKNHSPKIFKIVQKAVDNASQDLDFIRLNQKEFNKSPNISVDYAVMEKSNNVFVVPLDSDWSDIGSWSALYDISNKDNHGNVLHGDIITKNTTNSYIYSYNHIVTTAGIDNVVIIDTPDATLIANKDEVHNVKSIVKSLKKEDRYESHSNRKVYRPWGWYDSIQSGEYFQVKRLHVKPGGKLSLQKHHKRAEHWVVVSGSATVTKERKIFTLHEGESTYIPIGTIHSLENKKNFKLEIIEVQSGTYLGEDDIVRLEDIYGRIF